MSQNNYADAIRYFPWSEKRSDIYDVLLDGTCDLRDIKARTGLPRTTIRDNLGKMESLGWIDTDTSGTYRPTPSGRAAYESFEQYRDSIRVVNRFELLFEYVDPGVLDFELHLLLEAEMVKATEKQPLAPSTRLATLGAEADHLRGFLATVEPSKLVGNSDRIASGELTYELVANPRALRRLENVYGVPSASGPGQNHIHIFREEFPFGLAVFDDEVVTLYGYDHTEGTTVLVESPNPDLIEWGLDTFQSFRQRATPVSQVEGISPR